MEFGNLKVDLKGHQSLPTLCSLTEINHVSPKTSLIPRKRRCCDHLCPTVYIENDNFDITYKTKPTFYMTETLPNILTAMTNVI